MNTLPNTHAHPRSPKACTGLLAAVLVATGSARADVIHVPRDSATVQAAVDQATAGDRIVVGRGHYIENVVVDVPGIVLTTRGATVDGDLTGPAFTITADDVMLSGFDVRNTTVGVDVQADDVTLNGLGVAGGAGVGIRVDGVGVRLIRNRVQFVSGHGVELLEQPGGASSELVGNLISQNDGIGLLLRGGGHRVLSNRVEHNRDDGVLLGGDPDGSVARARVSGNQLHGNGRDGLCVVGLTDGVDLIGNDVRSNGRHGVQVIAGGEALVARNRVASNGAAGLDLQAATVVVERNRVESNRHHGVVLRPRVGGGDRRIEANVLAANGEDGVQLLVGHVSVRGNASVRNLGDGIDVQAEVQGVHLIGNRCIGNGHEGIDNSGQLTAVLDNACARNGRPDVGLDIAGSGNGGVGSVGAFSGNRFDTGGPAMPQDLDG